MSPSASGNRRAPAKKAAPARGRGTTKGRQRPAGVKGWALRALKWGALGALVLGIIGIAAAVFAYQRTEIPDPNKSFQTQTTFIYYANGKSKVGQFAEQNRESIPYAEMPDCIKDGVVAAENRTFWTDRGIDPKGIVRAAFSNAKAGGTTQGASTITQQYVKILYLTQERTYTRKMKEAFLSLKLQRTQSKQEILEGYLNTIYFGRSAYGIQAAARAFFDKPASKLDLQECAVLSSVINNPYRFDPANGPESEAALLQRYRYVLNGMAEVGAITDAEAAEAAATLPEFPKVRKQSSNGGQRGHQLRLVRDELARLGFSDEEITGGGLRVTTTFTKEAMDAAEQAVLEQRPEGFGDKQLHVGVASVEVGTGAVRGFYGGQDFLKSEINWAATGGMAGSTMKPFTLAAALEAGFSLKDTFEGNSPMEFPGGLEIENQGEGGGSDYGSQVDGIRAMEKSVNTAFVDMTDAIPDGPKAIYDIARAAGLPPAQPDPKFPGIPMASGADFNPENFLLTLGNAVVSPINMANAYATIANGGKRANAHVVTKVVDRSGVVRYEFKNNTIQAIDEDVAADVSYALQRTVSNGTASTAREIGRPAAAKTGTATNGRDEVSSAWFTGFTPQMATSVVYVRGKGNEQLDGWLPSYFGGAYPADTWAATMSRLLEGEEVLRFPPPAFVDGDAPAHGHDPVPTQAPKPEPTKTKKPKPKPTQSAEPPPPPATTQAPEPPPVTTPTPGGCLNPNGCPPSQSPSPSNGQPTPTGAPPAPRVRTTA